MHPNQTIREVIGRVTNPAQVQIAEPTQEEVEPAEGPLYEIHQVPMVWQKGRKGYFSACHETSRASDARALGIQRSLGLPFGSTHDRDQLTALHGTSKRTS